jgi:hypothetical protein
MLKSIKLDNTKPTEYGFGLGVYFKFEVTANFDSFVDKNNLLKELNAVQAALDEIITNYMIEREDIK